MGTRSDPNQKYVMEEVISMSKDLYETLGVDRKATKETIKAAYRKRAMDTHPDRGGSEDEFALVSKAYRVLSDPSMRGRYDKGEPVDGTISRESFLEQEAMNVLLATLNALMSQFISNPDRFDIIGQAKNDIIEKRRRCIDDSGKVSRDLSKIKKAISKVKYTGSRINAVEVMVNRKLEAAEKVLSDLKDQEEILLLARDIIKDYKWIGEGNNSLDSFLGAATSSAWNDFADGRW